MSRGDLLEWVGVLAVTATLSGCNPYLDNYGTVADFSFVDQNGQSVTRADLAGKVWVASFFFTRCATVCPQVTATMAKLRQSLNPGSGVLLVSFSVDPENDNPAVLKDYAERYAAEPGGWRFLTGPREEVYDLIRRSFQLSAEPTTGAESAPGNEVTHSTRLVLVDGHGHIRGYFEGRQVDELNKSVDDLPRLRRAINQLARGAMWFGPGDLPEVNAGLNTLSAILLTLGYFAIRQRRVRVHIFCMLSALCVSVVFLTFYLYYHLVVRNGQPTHFTGIGLIRPVYMGILLSHTLLAAIVAPLALFTAYLGIKGRLVRHVRIARWTLPIWLYVSITGVVVYLMLYQLYPSV